jgi:RNA polymerase sigma-70 factor (ECF subfamily)
MLGDTHAGEDAAQDAFFAAWRSLGRFRQDAKFSTWLYRIAMNRCLRDLRRRKDPPGRVPEDLPTSRGVPETELETAESIRAVSVAVALLAAERRIPLLLREVEGLSYDQIAEVLGVSMTAVKSRIYRARLDLVRTLSHSGPDAP